jgi:hypothetical protein
MTKVINLFGGPCAGKSRSAALIYAILKFRGVNVELAREWIKDLAWEDTKPKHSLQVLWGQYEVLHRLIGKVDCIVTDSPLLLQAHYCDKPELIRPIIDDLVSEMDNYNVWLDRPVDWKYRQDGRWQNMKEACEIHDSIEELLGKDSSFKFHEIVRADYDSIEELASKIYVWEF